WMRDEMRVAEGGFASSLDADSEGEEGRYYVWTASEIDDVLGPDSHRFRNAYGVREEGNWEGKNILNQLDSAPEDNDADLAPLRKALLARRATRIRPSFDDKVLADWNGLAIAALAEAGAVFAEPAWVKAARAAFSFVDREMTRPDGRLWHSWRAGRAQHMGMLDDYAFLADGALALLTADGDERWLHRAEQLMDMVLVHFRADDGGLWRTADDSETLIARPRSGHDDATPSGAGVAADVMARLWHLTFDGRWKAASEQALTSMSGAAVMAPAAYPSLLAAVDTLTSNMEIVIEASEPDAPGVRELLTAAWCAPQPARTVRVVGGRGDLPDGHAARVLDGGSGSPRAYVCHRNTCSLPVSSGTALIQLLDQLQADAIPSG
ncbi:MAG: thioredoxin domain-containing protein, partial [Rhodospirillales bacterium]|nr:thioredoxin domain-containing protein [Rhodospirillales bacterium]